jgi:dTDP-4-dehydrorhamnose 3,5-epimerase
VPFTFRRLDIPAVILVEPRVFPDDRGFFQETYKRSDFVRAGITEAFVQDNHSHSTAAVLRGLHYQKDPAAQGKLVSVISGEIFDVAVDLRRGSPTFGKWVGATLSAANHHMLYVPPGFGHGFCVISPEADVVYKVTAEYSPEHDRGVRWNDPDIGVRWPVGSPALSAKDQQHPSLQEADINFTYST